MYQPVLEEKGIGSDIPFIEKVVGLIKERANFVNEFWGQSYFFFVAPESYDSKTVKKRWKTQSPDQMKKLKQVLESITDFNSENIENIVKSWIEKNEYSMGAVMNAFRLLIVGAPKGPHMFDIVGLIGKEESVRRIENGLETLSQT